MRKSIVILFVFSSLFAFSQKENGGKLIYSDNFKNNLSNWKVEFEIPKTSSIQLIDSKLDLVSSRGATVWFDHKLS